MGLLDDAIREHLDLKRRRGADPTEIERLEHEALGPVRRGPGDAKTADPDAAPGRVAEPDWDDPFRDEREFEPPETAIENGEALRPKGTEPPTAAQDLPASEPDRSIEEDEPSAFEESEAYAPPAPRPAPGAPSLEPIPEDPDRKTAEYDVEHPPGEKPAEKKDDMLEETPEFLQDTPDHDRLWFEQRPPKDFDFDG